MDFVEGELIWIYPHDELGWAVGQITQVKDDGYIVCVKDQADDLYLVERDHAISVHPSCLEGVQDLLTLGDFNEGALLENVRTRYYKRQIYTGIGAPILISINPYTKLNIFNAQIAREYRQGNKILGPHLFDMAEQAYSALKDANQSIIISGESGAGKTEAAKLLMSYLTSAASEGGTTGVEQQLLDSNPLLEAFGNAKTLRNDNSSRFGKFVEVHFDSVTLKLISANINTYLLEKSRIVTQQKGERNYHVFYQLCAGASEEEKEILQINDCHDFEYLIQGECTEIDEVDDADNYTQTRNCMSVLGFSQEEQLEVMKVLAAILHIGNIEFEGEDQAEIVEKESLQIAAELLSLPYQELEKPFINRVLIEPRTKEEIIMNQTPDQARINRDTIAKTIYSRLFDWIVMKVNQSTNREKKKTKTIGILDIYGFEVFDENSFEQFCINYANEKLQQHFNQHMFKLEQSEYSRERIKWDHIQYEDNQDCIDLIEKKNASIISLLEQQCKLQKDSDAELLGLITRQLGGHPRFSPAGMFANTHFGIKHYAGDVYYYIESFLDKNKDTFNPLLLKVAQLSPGLIQTLFTAPATRPAKAPRRKGKTDTQAQSGSGTTLASQFKSQLHDLIKLLSSATPSYIRCIKPNHEKQPNLIDSIEVQRQLRCAGMLESIRIRKAGYSIRRSIAEFVGRYKIFVGNRLQASGITACKEIFAALMKNRKLQPFLDPERRLWQIGLQKVFMKEELQKVLDAEYAQAVRVYAIKVQSKYRGWRLRKQFTRIKTANGKIQSSVRAFLFTRKINKRVQQKRILKRILPCLFNRIRIKLARWRKIHKIFTILVRATIMELDMKPPPPEPPIEKPPSPVHAPIEIRKSDKIAPPIIHQPQEIKKNTISPPEPIKISPEPDEDSSHEEFTNYEGVFGSEDLKRSDIGIGLGPEVKRQRKPLRAGK